MYAELDRNVVHLAGAAVWRERGSVDTKLEEASESTFFSQVRIDFIADAS